MAALLVLYMVNQLLLPGHVEHVAGFAAFRRHNRRRIRAAVDAGARVTDFRPLSRVSSISRQSRRLDRRPHRPAQRSRARRFVDEQRPSRHGLRPELPFGIAAADHRLRAAQGQYLGAGRKRLPARRRSAPHARVRDLQHRDQLRRRRRAAALRLSWERYGWHIGFGTAALFMLGALATYLSGLSLFARAGRTKGPRRSSPAYPSRPQVGRGANRGRWRSSFSPTSPTISSPTCCRSGSSSMPTSTPDGFAIPIPWFYSIDPLVSILSVPVLFALWSWQERNTGGEPPALSKIAIGSFIAAAANLVLVAAIAPFSRPSAVGLAGALLRHPGRRFHVFLADPARAGFARGAAEDQRDDDGGDLPDPVRRQQPDRPDRHLLRKDEPQPPSGRCMRQSAPQAGC